MSLGEGSANPDVVIVGGGIAGSSLAVALSRAGFDVVLLERQVVFEDRIRGEVMVPWGVREAQRLDLLDALMDAGGVFTRKVMSYDPGVPTELSKMMAIDMSALIDGVPGRLSIGHPTACEALATLAAKTGARVIRGVGDVVVTSGEPPTVVVDGHVLTPRLVIGADGRTSVVRRQAGIGLHKSPRAYYGGGLLVRTVDGWPDDVEAVGSEGDVHYYVFPQGGQRTRLYVECDDSAKGRYVGAARTEAFQATFRSLRSLPMATAWADAEVLGPCGFHAWQDAWVDRCAVPGVVLIGDAAGYNDPITGQGLSIAMRDVRLLSDLLLGAPRWDASLFDGYSEKRSERMRRLRYVAAFFSEIWLSFGEGADERRLDRLNRIGTNASSLAVIMAMFLGPDSAHGELFGAPTWSAMFDEIPMDACVAV